MPNFPFPVFLQDICHSISDTKSYFFFQTTHLNAIEKHEKHLDRLVLVSAVNDHELLDLDYTAIVFAQELTRIELEHLCFLGPEELVHAFAKEMKSSSQSLPTDDVEAEAQVNSKKCGKNEIYSHRNISHGINYLEKNPY